MFNPGEKFESYEIVRSLGKGGMGQVFLALDTKLERHVALKFLHLDVDEGTHGVRARFEKEAKLLASFDHPNIVRIFAIGEYQGCPYLVMEYIEGQTLLQLIRNEELDVQNKKIFMRNILIGIMEAHANGVLHRDIKPANIILCNRTGMPKILDFGISKNISDDSSVITNAEAILGTVAYLAPEQIQSGEVSPQSDIFSMGILFYEMFTGANPFKTPNNVSTMYNICNKTPSLCTEAPEEVPNNIRMIVDKMIAKEVLDRYYSVEDIISDFDSEDSLSLPNLHTLVAGEDVDEDVMTRNQAMETLNELGYSEKQVDSILNNAALEIEQETPGMSEFMDLKVIGKAIDKYEKTKPDKKHKNLDNFYILPTHKKIKWWRVGLIVTVVIFSGFYFLGEMIDINPRGRKVATVETPKAEAPTVMDAKEKLNRVYLVRSKNMDTGEITKPYKERLEVISQSGDFYYGKLINEGTGKENKIQFVSNPFLPPLRKVANVGEAEVRNVIRRADTILPILKGKKFYYYFDQYRNKKKVQHRVNCHAGESAVYHLAGKNIDALEITCLSKANGERITTEIIYSSELNVILRESRFFKRDGDRFKEIRELIER